MRKIETFPDLTASPGANGPLLSDSASGDGHETGAFIDTISFLLEEKRTVLLTALVCAALAAIVAFLLPNEYTATVLLMPPQQNSSMASQFLSAMGTMSPLAELAGSSLGLKNSNDMYVAMLKSKVVEDGMIAQFHLRKEYHKHYLSEARKAFEKHVILNGSGKDGLIHIAVEDRNPQRAAQMANSYVAHFRTLNQHLAVSEAGQRVVFFHQQLKQVKNKLANAEEALKQTEESTGLIQLSSQARALIESAAELRARISVTRAQIQALRTFAAGHNAQLQEAQQELASLRSQLNALGGSQQNPNSLLVPKGRVPQAGLEYARKLRDVKYYEAIFEILARQYELAKLEQAREGALVQVVDPAIVPHRKSWPPRGIIILSAAIFGLLLGSAIALTRGGISRMQATPVGHARLARLKRALRRKRTARDVFPSS